MEPKEPQDELGVASPPQESPALEKATDEDMEMHRKWNVAFREKVKIEDEDSEDPSSKRKQAYLEKLEAEEIRRLAQEAIQRQVPAEDDSEKLEVELEEDNERTRFIANELKCARQSIPKEAQRAFSTQLVQLDVSTSHYSSITVKITFPADYPNAKLNIDMTSKTLHEDVVKRIKEGCTAEIQNSQSKNGVELVYTYCHNHLMKNHLLSAYPEIKKLKDYIQPPSKILSIDNKSGTLKFHIQEGNYEMSIKIKAYNGVLEYPEGPIEIKVIASNLPEELSNSFRTLAEAKVRLPTDSLRNNSEQSKSSGGTSGSKKKVHPKKMIFQSGTSAAREQQLLFEQEERRREQEIKARFEASKPKKIVERLFNAVSFIHTYCVQGVVTQKCGVCEKRVLPSDPKACSKIPLKLKAERLYCNHFYHRDCLDKYINTPPFGKTCHTCHSKIQHHKWDISTKVLEERWAAQQARDREISDVLDMF